ncbi:Legume lectin, alpha chain, conserved site [Sesbania bispinosa]|nr:Legume lectin, alpha chain, conserved site [Sesbania bispinosa]
MANPSSVFPMSFLFFLVLITSVKSDFFSFNFPSFPPRAKSILVDGNANTTGGILQLTKKDQFEFSFVVNPKGSKPHGDGFTFYVASVDFDFPEENSEGGFLGLFTRKTAFNTSKNSIVAVEFDSITNEWDPIAPKNSPHIGIDINTIRSAVTAPWPIDSQPEGAIGKARISYRGATKELSVSVTYSNSPVRVDVALSHPIDFSVVLSEWVIVGFTAATGEFAETHDILSWSFTSFL